MGAHLLPRLRCYFAEFLKQGSLTRLRILSSPTCVGLRYGHLDGLARGFSWQHGIDQFENEFSPHHLLALSDGADLPAPSAYGLIPGQPLPGWPTLLRPPNRSITSIGWYRNVDLFPIGYASLPRLRGRLTLGRRPLPRKPQVFGERDSHPLYRYSCQHNPLHILQRSLRYAFTGSCNAPLPKDTNVLATASARGFRPVEFSAQAHWTSELLRFL
jgi:hypothetical protein